MKTANIIGSGPNGLAAAITLAQAGVSVTVYERNANIGGACSTDQVTLPGFHHDLGSSAFPMAAASPFFLSLPLEQYGLRWIQPGLPLAHPFDDGSAVALTPAISEMSTQLGQKDAAVWQRFFRPLVEHWSELAPEVLSPVLHVPQHPLLLARFGLPALLPAATLARLLFRDEPARALFMGCAAHSVMPLDSAISAAIGIVLATAGHAVGWPVAAGGAQSLTNALAAYLQSLGGEIRTGVNVRSLPDLEPADATFFDTSARALEQIAGDRLAPSYRRTLLRYRSGPGVFKVDWALSQPIPWRAAACRRAGTVHIGGTSQEIIRAERAVFAGQHSAQPFVLLVQPSVCDPSRAPAGQHTAWGYCHVPNNSTLDQTHAIESQIERFAPGFRDCILARRTQSASQLEAWNPNLIGGDLSGGAMSLRQMLFRPGPGLYATSDPTIFLCSSFTPPGGGVHGMCGYHAARLALQRSQHRGHNGL